MTKEEAALWYASAKAKADFAQKPIDDFKKMLAQWDKMRTFSWGGVSLEMTDAVASAFKTQLYDKKQRAEEELEKARTALYEA